MKAIVFGATLSAKTIYDEISKKYEIVGYCDNDSNKWGQLLGGKVIVSPNEIMNIQ